MTIRVVTDSGSDLPPELRDRYGIRVVPLTITFGNEEFKDGVNLSKEEFMQRLAQAKVMPSTTQPSPADFARAYEELKAEGATHIISVHMSSAFSGTYQSAIIGAGQVSGVQVLHVDTLAPSMAVGLMAIEAAKLAREGEAPDRIVAHLRQMRSKLGVYFTVGTLEYLARNGRIGKAQALLGSVLNIKPVLTITDDGMVGPYAKARGKSKAFDIVVDAAVRHAGGKPVKGVIMQALAEEDAAALKERLMEQLPGSDIFIEPLGPTIGSHVGPGTVGVIAFAS